MATSTVPFYLRPNEDVKTPVFGQIDVTANNPVNDINYSNQSTGMWHSLAGDLSSAKGYVWDEITGAWVSVKESATGAVKGLADTMGGFIDSIRSNILIGVGLLLLIIWIVAKSGILKQAAAFV